MNATVWTKRPARRSRSGIGITGDPPIDHLDLYRIDDPREMTELGLDEVFDGTSIVFIEWWTHAPGLLPADHYEVTIAGAGDAPRTVRIERAQ